jgi:GNAT superfamily N-acetyltransferase
MTDELSYQIRDANPSDAGAVSALVSSLARQHIADSLGDGGLEFLLSSMDVISTLQRLADGWPHLIAVNGEELLAALVVKPPTHLYHLFVRSDLRRTGIGSKLFSVADARVFRSTGGPLATVNSSLNAVAAYQRFGFVVDGAVVDRNGVRFQPMVRKTASPTR